MDCILYRVVAFLMCETVSQCQRDLVPHTDVCGHWDRHGSCLCRYKLRGCIASMNLNYLLFSVRTVGQELSLESFRVMTFAKRTYFLLLCFVAVRISAFDTSEKPLLRPPMLRIVNGLIPFGGHESHIKQFLQSHPTYDEQFTDSLGRMVFVAHTAIYRKWYSSLSSHELPADYKQDRVSCYIPFRRTVKNEP